MSFARSALKLRNCPATSRWVSSAVSLSRMSALVSRQLVDRRLRQGVPAVDDLLQAVAGAVVEGVAELVQHGAEVVDVDAADEVVEVRDELGRRDRDRGAVRRDDVALVEERRPVALRLQVDVLLADRRAVGDDGPDVGGDLHVRVEPQADADAVLDQVEVATLPTGTPR